MFFYKRRGSQGARTIVTCPFAVTAEAKALMEQILASNGSKEEIAADPRVSKISGALGASFEITQVAKPTHVFGQAIGNVYHSNDVFKIQLALQEGGIFLDQGWTIDSCHLEFTLV